MERFKEKSRERFLSGAEFQKLGEVLARAENEPLAFTDQEGTKRRVMINPQAIRAIRLLIFTGARVGEVLGLRWEHIDTDRGRANLPDSKTGKKVIQLAAPALEVLANAERPENGKGFIIRGGDASNPEIPLVNIKDPWGIIRSVANLGGVRLHDLRHAFASIAVAGGMSLPMIGALLGHRETRTTSRYAHLADDPQRAAADRIAQQISQAMKPTTNEAQIVRLDQQGAKPK